MCMYIIYIYTYRYMQSKRSTFCSTWAKVVMMTMLIIQRWQINYSKVVWWHKTWWKLPSILRYIHIHTCMHAYIPYHTITVHYITLHTITLHYIYIYTHITMGIEPNQRDTPKHESQCIGCRDEQNILGRRLSACRWPAFPCWFDGADLAWCRWPVAPSSLDRMKVPATFF
jgi:hypothetical protein